MDALATVNNLITNAPLSTMIEKMGMSIANAQAALDSNSIEMLKQLAAKPVEINGTTTNLLALGFVPTFYAFTEASFEAKMEFSLAESEAFSVGGSLDFSNAEKKENNSSNEKSSSIGLIAVSVNASYSRKFDQSASGSSSIAARMVSLPPPENLLELLKSNKK
jgi:hypothetical protein